MTTDKELERFYGINAKKMFLAGVEKGRRDNDLKIVCDALGIDYHVN